MKKYGLFIVCLLILSFLLTACKPNTKPSMVQAQRRLGKYFQTETERHPGVIDLSEGPKLKYDAKFGPSDVNFEFKIVNPY